MVVSYGTGRALSSFPDALSSFPDVNQNNQQRQPGGAWGWPPTGLATSYWVQKLLRCSPRGCVLLQGTGSRCQTGSYWPWASEEGCQPRWNWEVQDRRVAAVVRLPPLLLPGPRPPRWPHALRPPSFRQARWGLQSSCSQPQHSSPQHLPSRHVHLMKRNGQALQGWRRPAHCTARPRGMYQPRAPVQQNNNRMSQRRGPEAGALGID